MAFTIEFAQVSVTGVESGVTYDHDFVTNITINDPRENAMAVSPQGGGKGIVYRNGTTSAVTADMVARGMPAELLAFYKEAFDKRLRLDVIVIDSQTGERYDLNESIMRTNPINTTIGEGEGSLDQGLNFATPPAHFRHVGPSV